MNVRTTAGIPAHRPSGPVPGPAMVLQVANPFHRIGLLLLVPAVYVLFSRLLEFVLAGYKIPSLLLATTMLCLILSGRWTDPLSNRTGTFAAVFFVWIIIILPFSSWRSNSLAIVLGVLQSVLIFAAVAGFPVTAAHLRRVCYGIGFGSFTAAVLSFRFGSMESGRLELLRGSFLDPNDYAMTMLAGLPFVILAAVRRKGFTIVLSASACVVILYVFLRTGSRGGLIAFGAVLVSFFLSQSNAKKVALGVGLLIVIPLAFAALPEYIRHRYTTFFTVDETQVADERLLTQLHGADVGSSEARLHLLIESLYMTARHPLTGVGPGNFASAYWGESKEQGKRVGWHVSHNSYTQISSETGIMGAIFFVCMLVSSYRGVASVRNNPAVSNELRQMAQAIRLTMIAVYVCAAFLSIGYWSFLFILAGLSVALRNIAEQELAAARALRP